MLLCSFSVTAVFLNKKGWCEETPVSICYNSYYFCLMGKVEQDYLYAGYNVVL